MFHQVETVGRFALFAPFAGVAVVVTLTAPALAASPPCSSLPNPVYMQIGDTQEPLIKKLGVALRAAASPITLIYKTAGSCTNVQAMYSGTKLATNPLFVPTTTEVPGWDPTQASPSCTLDVDASMKPIPVSLDIGNSNILVSGCKSITTPAPANLGSFIGGIQPYVFIAPNASTQVAITGEEGYFLFGDNRNVTPWGDPAFMFIRGPTRSTLVAISAALGIAPASFKGTVPSSGAVSDSSSLVLSSVQNSAQPEATIGLMGAEVYDQNRDKVKTLAFKTYGQKYAYYPDSTSGSRDKQNLRDGHYVIWSPTVYLATVDAQNNVANPLARYVVSLITANAATVGSLSPAPAFDPIATAISVGLVPDCAMKVSRNAEGGDLSLYAPAAPCGCYFESKVGTPKASCVTCSADATCGSGKCRLGFCEAR